MELIRDLTLEKMREAFSSKKSVTPREKLDTTGLYKKLEVELINSRNTKLEIEKELQQEKRKVQELSATNSQWRNFNLTYLKRIVGAGLLAGIAIGGLLGFLSIR